MPLRLRPPDIRRRSCLLAALPWPPVLCSPLQLADAQGVAPLAHVEQRGQRAIAEILRRAGARA